MNDKASKLCRAIDDLLLSDPRKSLVVKPEVQELLRVAQIRREVGRRFAAVGASRQKENWRRLKAALTVR